MKKPPPDGWRVVEWQMHVPPGTEYLRQCPRTGEWQGPKVQAGNWFAVGLTALEQGRIAVKAWRLVDGGWVWP